MLSSEWFDFVSCDSQAEASSKEFCRSEFVRSFIQILNSFGFGNVLTFADASNLACIRK